MPGEQGFLAGPVAFHIPVEVEVILGQVGKDGHVEPAGVHPVEVEPEVAARARSAVERMLEVGRGKER